MYSKNIRNNPSSGLCHLQEILAIGQNFGKLEHNRAKSKCPCKMLDFRQISESTETLSKPSSEKIKCFRNTFVLCIS